MTDRQKQIDAITDDLYFYMIEMVSRAGDLEAIHLNKDGETLRSIADQLERLAIRIMDKANRKEKAL